MSKPASTHVPHILPLKVYLSVAVALLVFTVITVYISTLNFGPFNLVVAMIIAAIKATLVALFFMHLRYDSKLYMIIFVAAVMFLAVFIILTMFDTMARDKIYDVKARPINPMAGMYDSLTVSQPHSVPDTAALHRQLPADTSGKGH
ncbi:MAG TPA: cytochrome C oxidase subunit IV family protein [Candidatus Deferrimicrobium sp.]|nr:cytochrome C oxidase subunit IV family protein [Candidatus Deferrimicrobium sp.]